MKNYLWMSSAAAEIGTLRVKEVVSEGLNSICYLSYSTHKINCSNVFCWKIVRSFCIGIGQLYDDWPL